jgi:tetratricopeptide (TPR) repeat protein
LKARAAAGLLVGLMLAISPAFADGPSKADAKRARALFDEGVALSDDGKWADALSMFQRSDALVSSASARYNIAATLRALGRYVEARGVLDEILADAPNLKPPMKPALKGDVEKLLGEVKEKIVTVALKVSPASAAVQMDGNALPLGEGGKVEVDPGRHVFVVKAAGYDTTTVTRTLWSSDIEVRLTAPKSVVVVEREVVVTERPFYTRAWFLTTVGVVVAGAVTAAIVVAAQPKAVPPAGPPTATVDRVIPVAVRF